MGVATMMAINKTISDRMTAHVAPVFQPRLVFEALKTLSFTGWSGPVTFVRNQVNELLRDSTLGAGGDRDASVVP